VEPASIRRLEARFAGAGGLSLFRRSWLGAAPRRAVLLVHGWAEHSGRYDHVGAWLAARGCAVHAFDHRGHGRSYGARGHARGFDELLDDVECLLERVRVEHPELPVFVVGHSMGGLVVTLLVAERALALAGAVTSGPALALTERPSGARLALLRAAARVAPRARVARPISGEGLSRDPDVARAYESDPLVLREMTLGFGRAFLAAVERASGANGRVRVPLLMLHGEEDPLCPADASRRFFEGLAHPSSDLRLYEGLRHEILNEPEREAVLADLLAWLEKTELEGTRAR
jgi:alpha-beta hydrolase superfamily lysophospholipase